MPISKTRAQSTLVRFVRFQIGETISYGILEDERVRQLDGDLFSSPQKTNTTYSLAEVKLLVPTKPTQVLALAGNYNSHLYDAEVPEKYQFVQPFLKSPSCLLEHNGTIVLPKDADPVHYEAELVIVLGKKTSKVSKEEASEHIMGVTCGNDISARNWQKNDVHWWRAKGSDTFGPCGPCIACGLDYDNLQLTLRLNGEVRQDERTDHLINDVASIVSAISQHVVLHPGDLIYSGTPGKTDALKPGDIVEVELEGVGILRNECRSE